MSKTHQRWRDLDPAHAAVFQVRALGTDLVDDDQTIRPSDGRERHLRTLTKDITITVSDEGAEVGQTLKIVKLTESLFTATVVDKKSGSTIEILDVGLRCKLDLVFTRSGWISHGYGAA